MGQIKAHSSKDDYISQLGSHIQNLIENGVEIINWGINDPSAVQRGEFDFFAIWKFPDQDSPKRFEALVEGVGWYNYFEQVNASGEANTSDEILGKSIDL